MIESTCTCKLQVQTGGMQTQEGLDDKQLSKQVYKETKDI